MVLQFNSNIYRLYNVHMSLHTHQLYVKEKHGSRNNLVNAGMWELTFRLSPW